MVVVVVVLAITLVLWLSVEAEGAKVVLVLEDAPEVLLCVVVLAADVGRIRGSKKGGAVKEKKRKNYNNITVLNITHTHTHTLLYTCV